MAQTCLKGEMESPMELECLNGCLESQMAQTCLKGEMESPMELECLNGCLESQVSQVCLKSVVGSWIGSTEPN